MKRFLLFVSAVLISVGAWSQASIALNSLPEDAAGNSVSLTLNLDNAESVKAFQCDLTLPGSITFNEAVPALTGRTDGFDVAYRFISDKQLRILVSSGNMSLIAPDSAVVVTLDVAVPAQAAADKDSMLVSNAIVVFEDYGVMAVPDRKYAAFAIKPSYIISYMNEGVEVYRDTIVQDEVVTPPVLAMEKEGYSFLGWDKLPEVMPGHDVVVNAMYEKLGYNLVFIVDGDTLSASTVAYNDTIVVPELSPREGYTFSGWGDLPVTMPARDVTAVGSFTVNKYKVTYLVDGEVYYTDSVAYGTAITPLAAPVKEGSTFSGWTGLPETMPARDITVTGSFATNGYTLTYVVDGEEYKSIVYEYGAAITPEAAPAKEGYTFSGWSEIPGTMPAGDVTVSGSFTVNRYKITYTVDGEVYATDSVAYGTAITPESAPAKEGYTFSGWSEIPETMPAGDVTVSGSFTVNRYKITYTVDGEVYATDSVAYGTAIIPLEEPAKEGYTFSGWSEMPVTMPARDVVVTGAFVLNATQIDAQGLEYQLNEEGTAFSVVDYAELQPEVVVPATLYGLPVDAIADKALMGAYELVSIVIPGSIAQVGDRALYGCHNLLVVEWNTAAPLRAECFSSPEDYGNMLVFASANSGFEGNVVVNGVAEQVTLTDGRPLRNPRGFVARSVRYTREFIKKTSIGVSGGWEAMVLPFDVQTVTSAKGELKPFGEADFVTSLPCWIATMQADGTFADAGGIKANVPFIMEVPNSDEYEEEYNIEGEVSFSASDVTVYATVGTGSGSGAGGYQLLGSYEGEASASGVYALNDEEYTVDGVASLPGGVFVADSRDIRPFEAYVYSAAPGRAPYLRIGGGNGTGIGYATLSTENDAWYTLQGIRLSGKPHERGVYIVNGKKVIVK